LLALLRVSPVATGERLSGLGGVAEFVTDELPRSKLTGYQTNRESLTQLSPPHVSSGGLVLTSPGFPLKACGNDGLR
jgi:hypothetical protein